jgi:hypothetical protein
VRLKGIYGTYAIVENIHVQNLVVPAHQFNALSIVTMAVMSLSVLENNVHSPRITEVGFFYIGRISINTVDGDVAAVIDRKYGDKSAIGRDGPEYRLVPICSSNDGRRARTAGGNGVIDALVVDAIPDDQRVTAGYARDPGFNRKSRRSLRLRLHTSVTI